MSADSTLSQIKKCVTFIFIKLSDGRLHPNGTGFFVGVASKTDPARSYCYLVTAKHVLQDSNGNFYPEILIRLNTKDGSSELIPILLNYTSIFVHDEKDVDIAVLPCLPNENIFDFLLIPDKIITNQDMVKQQQISEGDDVFFAGLFTSHVGQKRNQPIIRFGKVALLSDEKIEWKEKDKPPKFLDLYLLECQSYGGNSGSPVFFNLDPSRTPGQIVIGPKQVYFAGLMTGSFLSANEVAVIPTENRMLSLQNVGIDAVTPSYKLYDILFSKRMEDSRQAKSGQSDQK
jgi:hypothetical protein